MDWLSAMNNAVEYLEDNITEKLDIEKVAKIALSSNGQVRSVTMPLICWCCYR